MIAVYSPVNGTTFPLSDVPDPVFANGIMGAGIALHPADGADALCPVSGTVTKIMPHAFIVEAAPGVLILVHLGISTVGLPKGTFQLHIQQGQHVEQGMRAISWNPDELKSTYKTDTSVIVVAIEKPQVDGASDGVFLHAGDELFRVDA